MVEMRDSEEIKEVEGRNLVILPPESVAGVARELSGALSQRFETNFVLNTQDRIVHITIYQANYRVNNLAEIRSRMQNFARGTNPFELSMGSYSNFADYIFWDVERTGELQRFHERTVDILNPVREPVEGDPGFVGLTAGQRESFEKYGTVLAYGEFLPHITLTRFRNYSDAQAAIKLLSRKTAEFLVDRVCLATIGPDGTATEILEEYRF